MNVDGEQFQSFYFSKNKSISWNVFGTCNMQQKYFRVISNNNSFMSNWSNLIQIYFLFKAIKSIVFGSLFARWKRNQDLEWENTAILINFRLFIFILKLKSLMFNVVLQRSFIFELTESYWYCEQWFDLIFK